MSITAHDPIAMNNTKSYFGSEIKINYAENWKSCVKNIDIVIIATTWSEYKDLAKFDDIINGKVILDARGFLDPEHFKKNKYITIN